MTWGAYPPGIARTVVNCNQNCNHGPEAGVVRQVEARSGLDAGPGASAGRGLRGRGLCLRMAMALDGPLPVRSARRRARAARPPHSPGGALWRRGRLGGRRDRAATRRGGVPGDPGGCSAPRGFPAEGSRPGPGAGQAIGLACGAMNPGLPWPWAGIRLRADAPRPSRRPGAAERSTAPSVVTATPSGPARTARTTFGASEASLSRYVAALEGEASAGAHTEPIAIGA